MPAWRKLKAASSRLTQRTETCKSHYKTPHQVSLLLRLGRRRLKRRERKLAGRRSDMSDAANPPGYSVGRPTNHEEQQAPQPVDEQNATHPQVPGYYSGYPLGKRPPTEPTSETGFFAKWFGCFSGGGNAR